MAGVYIHIPFCRRKCCYCNFFSVAAFHRKPEFLKALMQEIGQERPAAAQQEIRTVYFGGGSPGLLDPSEIFMLLTALRERMPLDQNAEVTLELNPEDLKEQSPEDWLRAGINRFSLGIQTFDEHCLDYLSRNHTAGDAQNALQKLMKSGANSVSADLILGIPGQTDASLTDDLRTLAVLGVHHISVYALTVEEQTALNARIRKGLMASPDEAQTASQFLITMDLLEELGYEHYEISNYALPEHRSKHNSAYWNGTNYWGFGPSAHSYDGHSRWWNPANLDTYIRMAAAATLPLDREVLSPLQKLNEYILTRIRTREGIDLKEAARTFNEKVVQGMEERMVGPFEKGWLAREGNRIYLSRSGKLMADHVTALLMDA